MFVLFGLVVVADDVFVVCLIYGLLLLLGMFWLLCCLVWFCVVDSGVCCV